MKASANAIERSIHKTEWKFVKLQMPVLFSLIRTNYKLVDLQMPVLFWLQYNCSWNDTNATDAADAITVAPPQVEW